MKFGLGRLVMTPGVERLMLGHDLAMLVVRHGRGDWGEIDEEDRKANEEAMIHGARLMSVYSIHGEKVWVITEADRSVTTVLLPDEY